MKKTTCPLDCYDACSVIYEDGRLKGDKKHPLTRGFLCPSLNGFLNSNRVLKARYRGKEISLKEALEILVLNLKKYQNKETLFFRGSGNMGFLQRSTELFFHQYGATFTRGSLCDGAGNAGVIKGRGANLILPISEIKKSEVVVVWGRDISVTNSHMMDIIKDKILIVVDPVKTDIAKKADIHLQIRPRSDFFLAILFARFAYLEEMYDESFISNRCEDFDYFVDFFQSFGIKKLYQKVDVNIDDALTALMLMGDSRRVSFLVGVGVQKYSHGDSVLRAIDSLAAMLGLFGREGCGVSYLGDSGYGFKNPFNHNSKRVDLPTISFLKFSTIFIQGANPLEQMPDSKRVFDEISKMDFVVYFGLYENETSKIADLVIPAKSFLEKDDIRASYGSEYIGIMPKVIDSKDGICEYELANFLLIEFGLSKLKRDSAIIEEILESNSIKDGEFYRSLTYSDTPYKDSFFTDSGKFIFIDEIIGEDDLDDEDGYFLITSKSKHSINSQFKRDNYLYISKNSGYSNGELVTATSNYGGSEKFIVKITDRLRDDTILIHSGAKGVNRLTPNRKSYEGNSAVYQDVKIKLSIV